MPLDLADDRRQLHRQQHLTEKALLGGLEARPCGRLGTTVQRFIGQAVDDAG